MPPIVCHEIVFEKVFSGEMFPNEFGFPQPTTYSGGNDHGLVIYGRPIDKVVVICDTWPGSNDSDCLVEYLTNWLHEKVIQNPPYQELGTFAIKREVEERALFLITGTEFFGYAKHMSSLDGIEIRPCDWWPRRGTQDILGPSQLSSMDPSPWFSKCQAFGSIVYPVAQGRDSYTLEQVQLKEHLDENYHSNPPPSAESRQELSDLLDDVSRMMREGRKRLIATSIDLGGGRTGRRDWIAPEDVRMGDVITDITHCGRIGVLLRPIGSHLELGLRPPYQLIGIVWSLDGFHRHKHHYSRSQELVII